MRSFQRNSAFSGLYWARLPTAALRLRTLAFVSAGSTSGSDLMLQRGRPDSTFRLRRMDPSEQEAKLLRVATQRSGFPLEDLLELIGFQGKRCDELKRQFEKAKTENRVDGTVERDDVVTMIANDLTRCQKDLAAIWAGQKDVCLRIHARMG
jgi:hypothetical protein